MAKYVVEGEGGVKVGSLSDGGCSEPLTAISVWQAKGNSFLLA